MRDHLENIVDFLEWPLALICMFGVLFGGANLFLWLDDRFLGPHTDPTDATLPVIATFAFTFFVAPIAHDVLMWLLYRFLPGQADSPPSY